jgi:redox-sensitive bicupin YhaK (pirin superfamily)
LNGPPTADVIQPGDTGRVGAQSSAGPQIQVRRAGRRFRTRTEQTDTSHSFSFGEHYDPANVSFGPLLVNNDDVVSAGPGYDPHPHANAEILTWVLSGSLVHEDSSGRRTVVHRGLVQRMSAGSGIVHAERNDAFRLDPTRAAEPVHFVQMWVLPDVADAPPSYQQARYGVSELDQDWLPVASGGHAEALVSLDSADSTLWATVLGQGACRTLPAGALLHAYVTRGVVEVETVGELTAGDALRIRDADELRVTGRTEAELLVWSLARAGAEAR